MIYTLSDSKPMVLALLKSASPIDIEIGVGKGRFICELAQANPDRIVIGLEKSLTWLKRAEERQSKLKIDHLYLFKNYAEDFFREALFEPRISNYYILFPDPWPKADQIRRRMFNPTNIARIWHSLLPNGKIVFATDHHAYFKDVETLIKESFADSFIWQKKESLAHKTNFQIKYEQEKRPFYFAELTKTFFPPLFSFEDLKPYP